MQLARRSFLRLSALGSASLVLPLGSGCGGPTSVSVKPGAADELYFFDSEGRRLTLQPSRNRVLLQGTQSPTVIGGFGLDSAKLNFPTSLAVGADGRLFVADYGNGRVQVFDRHGRHLRQLGSAGSGPDQFTHAYGIALDDAGQLWVTDPLSHRVQRFTADGQWLGSVGEGELAAPLGIARGPGGRMHVVEAGSARVSVFSPSGTLLSRYGGRAQGMISPRSLAVDEDGTAWVTDATAAALFVFSPEGELLEHVTLTRDGAPASPVHVALGPDRTLEVATLPGAPV